jgi:hypothetical protein
MATALVRRRGSYAIPSLGYCLQDAGNLAFGLNETINDCMRNESAVGFALEQKCPFRCSPLIHINPFI